MFSYRVYLDNGNKTVKLHDVTHAPMIPRTGEIIRIDIFQNSEAHTDYRVIDVIHRIFKGEDHTYVIVRPIPKSDEYELY